jgi:hypothetical protein
MKKIAIAALVLISIGSAFAARVGTGFGISGIPSAAQACANTESDAAYASCAAELQASIASCESSRTQADFDACVVTLRGGYDIKL